MQKLLMTGLLLGASLHALADTPLWMRYNAISPDGRQIAFAYKGDIYVVNSEGGTARQLTTTDAYESAPVWSNDGKTIAFTSDREGSTDIYTMPAEGGAARRVTFNSASETPLAFSKDDSRIYFSAALQDPASSILFPAGWLTELYAIDVNGGRPEQIAATPVSSLDFDKDGASYLYYNRTGSENIWRKHHTSSVARDIFLYDAAAKRHRQITTNPGEDRDPHFTPDGKIVFLSERNGGSFNVYEAAIDDTENARPLTHFKKHPVRFLTQANDGTLCFGYHGEIYTKAPGKDPRKVAVNIVRSSEDNPISTIRPAGPSSISISDDGKDIAFISRGEVFAVTDKYATTKQITHTAAAEGDVVFTMDADLQDSPDEIPDMRRMILEEGYDMVSGWKLKRHDPIGKRWPSKFFNWTARTVSGIKLHDFNCGLKAYRRKVVKSIEVYGEMHRYIPILAKEAGFRRIGEKVVCHRARKYGSSKFGMERMVKGYLDLITVSFLSHFGRSPMYFFGGLGTLMFLLGGCSTIWIIAAKLYKQAHGLPLRAVTEQPLFYLSMLLVILGVQFFLAGFLGELIDRNASDRNKYLIDKNI